MSVQVSDSLQLGTVDTPLDARTRISTLGDVSNIALPFIGMMFFCASTGKYYRVISLKSKQIGAAQQANAQIDQYEVIPDKTDLDGKAEKGHNHDGTYAPADHQHTLSDLSDLSELENQFAAADHTHNYNELTGVPAPTSGITLGIIKSYDPETGTVTVQEANDDWTENPEGTIHENVIVP